MCTTATKAKICQIAVKNLRDGLSGIKKQRCGLPAWEITAGVRRGDEKLMRPQVIAAWLIHNRAQGGCAVSGTKTAVSYRVSRHSRFDSRANWGRIATRCKQFAYCVICRQSPRRVVDRSLACSERRNSSRAISWTPRLSRCGFIIWQSSSLKFHVDS